MVHLESLPAIRLLPLLGSRQVSTFDHKVVEAFILGMERNGVGLAAQANAFDKPKAILLDVHRLGLFDDDPVSGVKPPQYDRLRLADPLQHPPQALRQRAPQPRRLRTPAPHGQAHAGRMTHERVSTITGEGRRTQ